VAQKDAAKQVNTAHLQLFDTSCRGSLMNFATCTTVSLLASLVDDAVRSRVVTACWQYNTAVNELYFVLPATTDCTAHACATHYMYRNTEVQAAVRRAADRLLKSASVSRRKVCVQHQSISNTLCYCITVSLGAATLHSFQAQQHVWTVAVPSGVMLPQRTTLRVRSVQTVRCCTGMPCIMSTYDGCSCRLSLLLWLSIATVALQQYAIHSSSFAIVQPVPKWYCYRSCSNY
jgi:hypothetical protein